MNERQAVRDRIANHGPTAALLDTFEISPGNTVPAVFSPLKPVGYSYTERPAVIIRAPTAVDGLDTFGQDGKGARSVILMQVAIYAEYPENSTDDSAVEAAAKAIRQLFRGKGFVAADGLTYQALVSGPIAAPTEGELMVGSVLQIRLNVGG